MEVDKRKKKMNKNNNKRVTRETDCERIHEKKMKGVVEEEEEGKFPAEEEEVEEFYAILRRMKVVVKYFDDKGRGVREWREAIEKPDLTLHHHVDDNKEKGLTAQAFDLNTVAPEAADSGGA